MTKENNESPVSIEVIHMKIKAGLFESSFGK